MSRISVKSPRKADAFRGLCIPVRAEDHMARVRELEQVMRVTKIPRMMPAR